MAVRFSRPGKRLDSEPGVGQRSRSSRLPTPGYWTKPLRGNKTAQYFGRVDVSGSERRRYARLRHPELLVEQGIDGVVGRVIGEIGPGGKQYRRIGRINHAITIEIAKWSCLTCQSIGRWCHLHAPVGKH